MKLFTPKKISLLLASLFFILGSAIVTAQNTGSYTIKRPPTLAEKKAKEREAKRAAKLGIPFGKVIALKTASGKYVSSQNDKNNALRAVADEVGQAEKFKIEGQSGTVILIKALSNGNYLSVRKSEKNIPVRSNCTWKPAGWENIIWKKISHCLFTHTCIESLRERVMNCV